jgi:hypothetical protein
MADSTDLLSTSSTLDSLTLKTKDLTASAGGFARAMTQAFSASVTGGKQFDDVLKSLALRISDLAVRLAFKPLEKSLTSGISSLLSGLTGSAGGASASLTAASGAIKPFAQHHQRADRHARPRQFPPLGELHHRADRACGGTGAAEFVMLPHGEEPAAWRASRTMRMWRSSFETRASARSSV